MSAIAGLWSFDGKLNVAGNCQAMLAALSLYGPDHTSQYSNGPFSMGRCLLGLLPEDRFDRQPLSASRVTALVADVRLDNRDELAVKLEIPLHDAAGMADSEILLAAWQKWREQCLDHLTGGFAFAVWDKQEQELFLARDQIGERPLFYSFVRKIASPLRQCPRVSIRCPSSERKWTKIIIAHCRRFRNAACWNVRFSVAFFASPLVARSAFGREKHRLRRYWNPEQLTPLPLKRDEEYLEQFLDCFDAAVRARLRTTGKIGSQLSGGLDSSSVAATAARLLGARRPRASLPIRQFPRLDSTTTSGRTTSATKDRLLPRWPRFIPTCATCSCIRARPNFFDTLKLNSWLYDSPAYGPLNEVWTNAIMDQARENGITRAAERLIRKPDDQRVRHDESVGVVSQGPMAYARADRMADQTGAQRLPQSHRSQCPVAFSAFLAAPNDGPSPARFLYRLLRRYIPRFFSG